MKILIWVGITYFVIGFMIALYGTLESFMEDSDEELKWWMIPKTIAFCFFLAPAYLMYLTIQIPLEDYLIKRRRSLADKLKNKQAK